MPLKFLSLQDVQSCINMQEAIEAMEKAFKALYTNNAVLPLRTPLSIANERALMLSMPAYLSDQNALGIKVVSIFPNNFAKNKPAINGVILLLDETTGEAKALIEASFLTALRTGAVSGLATKYLAKKEASHVAIIGAGAQALTQFQAVACVRPIKSVSIWSRSYDNALKFAKNIPETYEVNCFEHVHEAVKDADVICTATSSVEPLIHKEHLKPGVHINAVGSHTHEMIEISPDVMAQSLVVVDLLEAAIAESGEIYAAINAKAIHPQDILELGAIVSDTTQKFKPHEFTVFKSVGLAIQDIGIANVVYQNALQKNVGVDVVL